MRRQLITNTWDRQVFNLRHEFPNEFEVKGNELRLSTLDLTIARNTFDFLLDNYVLARDLRKIGAEYKIEEGKLFVNVGGITMNATTAEEIFIFHEVFFRGAYQFNFPQKCIVLDIGMNVGTASLFFASLSNVERVFSFEPLVPTFEQAKYNLALNPELGKKIECRNVGLGLRNETIEVAYDFSNKGQAGIHGTEFIRSELKNVEKQKMTLVEASAVVRELIERNRELPRVMKVDCEGSEYAIIESLSTSNLLSSFNVIMIEWHRRGPDLLVELLSRAGFLSFTQRASETVGMIYATK
jgi:FkbM family methyltransferase